MKHNKELIDKLEVILATLGGEQGIQHKNSSIGYSEFTLKSKDLEKYITRFPYQKERHDFNDIQGNFRSSLNLKQHSSVLTPKNTIWRDSYIGGLILMNEIGSVQGKTGKIDVEIFSKYRQYDKKSGDTLDGEIQNAEQKITFNSLREFLEELRRLEANNNILRERLLKEEETSEIEKLKAELEESDKAIKTQKERIKRHIQKEIQLRDNPILDKNQEQIKRSKSFDGELIINGGPGTGKTTALIQRITYLTRNLNQDEEQIKAFGLDANEIPKLTKAEQELFNNQDSAWIFFSPSDLLKEYLRDAMIKEGLNADNSRVKTWESHRKDLMRDTRLIDGDRKNAFKPISRKVTHLFYDDSAMNFKVLQKTFSDYFWTEIRNSVVAILEIDTVNFDWSLVGQEIQTLIERIPKKNNLKDWIAFFNQLQRRFSDDVKEINESYKKNISDAVAYIMYYLKRNEADFQKLAEMIQEDKTRTQRPNEEDEDESDINEEIFEEDDNNLSDSDLDIQIKRVIKKLVRKVAIRLYDTPKTRLTTNDKRYLELLEPYIEDIKTSDKTTVDDIGQQAFFKKYFEKMTKGVVSNVLRPIQTQYKKFRRQKNLIMPLLTEKGLVDLDDLLKDNIRLYKEEQDFLIYFVFEFCRRLQAYSKTMFDESNYAFIASYKANTKGLVAVDEATDFSVFELAAMRTLTYHKFNSITLSGDIMQRMETKGIKSWDEFTSIFPTTTIADLTVSYRQTPVLLDLAKAIYKQNTGLDAPFVSYTEASKNDSKPILYIQNDFDKKSEWLVERIIEINRMYDRNFPSVAIFVKNDAEATKLADALNDNQTLEDENIEALACVKGRILGDKNCVRIFDIQYIKGLEFEAVFFMDIDDLGDLNSDLVNKYIYVGVSRATFFLGVTATQTLPDDLNYMLPHFDLNGSWV
jgi:superfamily I DNA/RNA helicase